MGIYVPSDFDPFKFEAPPKPRFDWKTAGLMMLTIIVAWLAIVGLCTVVMWGIG